MHLKRNLSLALALLGTTPALAHPGLHEVAGFSAGLSHPFGGLDHLLAMVAVGLLAASTGGRALWALPASFIGMMLVGGLLGSAGVEIPAVETGVLLSIIVLGSLVASRRSFPVASLAALAGTFALFHGHAHGAEIPAGAGFVSYGLGFVTATAALHLAGIAIGVTGLRRAGAMRLAGTAVATSGAILALV